MQKESIFYVNEIYIAPMGECNFKGSVFAIFIRLQGCHLRCYKTTLGCLCDTPKALSKNSFEAQAMTTSKIVAKCIELKEKHNVSTICLTGGDPLAFTTFQEVVELLTGLLPDFWVSVETSGIDFPTYVYKEHFAQHNFLLGAKLGFVIDWKVASAGIKNAEKRNVLLQNAELYNLNRRDYVKFVIHDLKDFQEFLDNLYRFDYCVCFIAVGLTWNSEITYAELFRLVLKNAESQKLLGSERLILNYQTHKLTRLKDTTSKEVVKINNFEKEQI